MSMGPRVPLLVCLVVGACGGAGDPISLRPPPPVSAVAEKQGFGFHAGETMAFEVSIAGVLAGEAALAVGQPGDVDGKRVVAVRSRLATAGAAALIKRVVDDATTVIDVDTGRPMRFDTEVEYGDNRYSASAVFAPNAVDVTWHRKDTESKGNVHFDFRTHLPHDAHSAMADVRQWRAPMGARRTVFVVGGRRLWRTDLTMGPRESLVTKMGNYATIRLDGVAYRARGSLAIDEKRKPRKFTVWVSDDADRVPLRVKASTELGDILIDLVDYQRP